MIVKKKELDKEKLSEELKNLLATNVSKTVVIGRNVYEIYPFSAMELFEILTDIQNIVEETKKEIIRERKELGLSIKPENINITINDVLRFKKTKEMVRELFKKILNGVDEEDINSMTIPQMGYLISALIEVNLKTLPEDIRNRLQQASGTNIEEATGDLMGNIANKKGTLEN